VSNTFVFAPFQRFPDPINTNRGACGKMNVASEFVVALNAAQFGSGADCFKGITMSFGGKTATATIVDEVCSAMRISQ